MLATVVLFLFLSLEQAGTVLDSHACLMIVLDPAFFQHFWSQAPTRIVESAAAT